MSVHQAVLHAPAGFHEGRQSGDARVLCILCGWVPVNDWAEHMFRVTGQSSRDRSTSGGSMSDGPERTSATRCRIPEPEPDRMLVEDFLLARIAEDEERARAEFAAKREVVKAMVFWEESEHYSPQVLEHMAAAYQDHPDYYELWRRD